MPFTLYDCRNALLEREGSGVGWLVHLQLVEKTNLAWYEVCYDASDGCRVCFRS